MNDRTASRVLLLRKKIVSLPKTADVVLDLSKSKYVDHTVISRIEEMKRDFAARGQKLTVVGLEHHKMLSHDPLAGRKLQTVS